MHQPTNMHVPCDLFLDCFCVGLREERQEGTGEVVGVAVGITQLVGYCIQEQVSTYIDTHIHVIRGGGLYVLFIITPQGRGTYKYNSLRTKRLRCPDHWGVLTIGVSWSLGCSDHWVVLIIGGVSWSLGCSIHNIQRQKNTVLALSVKVHHQVLEDIHVCSVCYGTGGRGGALAMDVCDGLSPHIQDQWVHESDVVLVAWLCRHLGPVGIKKRLVSCYHWTIYIIGRHTQDSWWLGSGCIHSSIVCVRYYLAIDVWIIKWMITFNIKFHHSHANTAALFTQLESWVHPDRGTQQTQTQTHKHKHTPEDVPWAQRGMRLGP